MSDVAKKYVKALMKTLSENELETLLTELDKIVPAYKNKKFLSIIQSSELSKDQKSSFLLSLFENVDKKIENFVKLLVQNDRADIVPEVAKDLANQLAVKNNRYEGVLVSDKKVKAQQIKEIEETLSKKLGVEIKLKNRVGGYSGMKVEIESLGVEIGLSTQRLKQQIAQTILNAI